MPINVRYDRDLGNMYAQALANSRRSQPAYADPNEDPTTDVNPFTLDPRQGAAINASLRRDRAALGAKQAPQEDTYAGANWLLPATIRRGDGSTQTVYTNGGVDPIASGGFGSLGTREQYVIDPSNKINPYDPEDSAKLAAVLNGPAGYHQLQGDFFDSAEEKRIAEETRKNKVANQQLVAQTAIRDVFNDENETIKNQRRIEENMRKERERAARERANNEARQSVIDKAKTQSAEATIDASEAMIDSLVTSMMEGQGEGYELSPSDSAFVRSALNDASNIRRSDKHSTEMKAKAMEALFKRLANIRARRTIDQGETPEQRSQREFNDWKMKEDYRNANKPKEQKPMFSPRDIERAAKTLEDASGVPPSQQEINAYLMGNKAQADQLNQQVGGGGVYETKAQDMGQALQEIQSLPKGAKFKHPLTGQVMERI